MHWAGSISCGLAVDEAEDVAFGAGADARAAAHARARIDHGMQRCGLGQAGLDGRRPDSLRPDLLALSRSNVDIPNAKEWSAVERDHWIKQHRHQLSIGQLFIGQLFIGQLFIGKSRPANAASHPGS